MFKQTYQSDLIPYRAPWVLGPPQNFPDGIPNGTGLQSLYNPELVTPPRTYGEALGSSSVTAIFARRQATATTDTTISVLCWLDMIYWPSWEIMLYRFDATTGAFIDRSEVLWGDIQVAWTNSVIQGFDGSIWVNLLTDLIEISDDLLTTMQTYTADHFDRTACSVPVVDKTRDIVIMPSEGVLNQISVYTLSTGEMIRTIGTSDQVKYICPVDDTRVFVLGVNDLLNLVDYATGEVLMTALCPHEPGAAIASICWDWAHRRLMVFAPTPDATDGACTSSIVGYYPVPLPVDLGTPIPITRLRKGKTAQVVTRLTGDVGEPIVGHSLSVATGDATVQRTSAQFDGQGYSTTTLNCTDAGTTTLTVSTSS